MTNTKISNDIKYANFEHTAEEKIIQSKLKTNEKARIRRLNRSEEQIKKDAIRQANICKNKTPEQIERNKNNRRQWGKQKFTCPNCSAILNNNSKVNHMKFSICALKHRGQIPIYTPKGQWLKTAIKKLHSDKDIVQ